MHLLLLLLGAVLAAAGAAMVRLRRAGRGRGGGRAVHVRRGGNRWRADSGGTRRGRAQPRAGLPSACTSSLFPSRRSRRSNAKTRRPGRYAPRPLRQRRHDLRCSAGSAAQARRSARALRPWRHPRESEPEPATPPVDLAPLTRIPETAPAPAPAPPLRAPLPKPAATPNSAATTVYRSGVIDGMAYSLFMDGSIEAELPTGRVKFATIDELQQYLASRKS